MALTQFAGVINLILVKGMAQLPSERETMIQRAIFLLFLFGVINGPSVAQDDSNHDVLHILGPGSVVSEPVTSDNMWQRIYELASEYRQYAPIPRVGFSDITYPANAKEYRAVDGYGILLVTVVTQDPAEVPLARVTLRGDRWTHTFQVLSSVRSPVEDPAVSSVFGGTRCDSLYLFPMHLRHKSGQLLVDFATNRKEFVLAKFPLDPFGDDLPTDPPSGPYPPPEAFERLIKRELPAFAVESHRQITRSK